MQLKFALFIYFSGIKLCDCDQKKVLNHNLPQEMNLGCQRKDYYLYCLAKNQQILFILKDKMEFLIALVSKNKLSWISE